MKYLTLMVFFLGLFPCCSAQESTRRVMHNFSAEALGVGVHYSLNYEYLFLRTLHDKLWLGAGVGYSFNTPKSARNTFYPLRFSASYGNIRNFYLEAGYDFVWGREKLYNSFMDRWMDVGYLSYNLFHIGIRYQRESKGLHFKAYIMPILNNLENESYLYFIDKPWSQTKNIRYWYGLGIGYSLY